MDFKFPSHLTFLSGIYLEKLTVHSEQVRLHDVLIPESMARVIARVFQLHVCQIQAAIVEDADLQSIHAT